MKNLGHKTVPIHKIVAGEGFGARCEGKAVSELVHAIRTAEGEPDVPPVAVRARDWRVATGEDALAAYVVLGRATVKCVVLELDDEEFVALRTADEARISMGRDAYRDATIALIDKVENRAESERVRKRDHALETRGVDIGLGRGVKTTRGEARKLVAQLLGTTVDALRKAEARKTPRAAPVKRPEEWKLECYGNVASAALLADAKRIHAAMLHADTNLRNAQREVSKVDDTRLGQDRYVRVHEALHTCAVMVRQLVPSHLCPWCKDVAAIRTVCAACWGGGYVTASHFESAPEQLRKYPCVSYGGQYVDALTMKPYRFSAPPAREPEEFVEGFYADSEPPVAYDTEAEPDLADEAFPTVGATSPETAELFDEAQSGVLHVDEIWMPPDPSEEDIERIRESCETDDDELEPDPWPPEEEGDELL